MSGHRHSGNVMNMRACLILPEVTSELQRFPSVRLSISRTAFIWTIMDGKQGLFLISLSAVMWTTWVALYQHVLTETWARKARLTETSWAWQFQGSGSKPAGWMKPEHSSTATASLYSHVLVLKAICNKSKKANGNSVFFMDFKVWEFLFLQTMTWFDLHLHLHTCIRRALLLSENTGIIVGKSYCCLWLEPASCDLNLNATFLQFKQWHDKRFLYRPFPLFCCWISGEFRKLALLCMITLAVSKRLESIFRLNFIHLQHQLATSEYHHVPQHYGHLFYCFSFVLNILFSGICLSDLKNETNISLHFLLRSWKDVGTWINRSGVSMRAVAQSVGHMEVSVIAAKTPAGRC